MCCFVRVNVTRMFSAGVERSNYSVTLGFSIQSVEEQVTFSSPTGLVDGGGVAISVVLPLPGPDRYHVCLATLRKESRPSFLSQGEVLLRNLTRVELLREFSILALQSQPHITITTAPHPNLLENTKLPFL